MFLHDNITDKGILNCPTVWPCFTAVKKLLNTFCFCLSFAYPHPSQPTPQTSPIFDIGFVFPHSRQEEILLLFFKRVEPSPKVGEMGWWRRRTESCLESLNSLHPFYSSSAFNCLHLNRGKRERRKRCRERLAAISQQSLTAPSLGMEFNQTIY